MRSVHYFRQQGGYTPEVPVEAPGFQILDFPGSPVSTASANYPTLTTGPAQIFTRTWQVFGDSTGVGPLVSNGGIVPDSIMIQEKMTTAERVAGHGFVRHEMGIPYWDGSRTWWGEPGVFDTSNPAGSGGTIIRNDANGPFRLHFSKLYELNLGSSLRSQIYRDYPNNPTIGRLSGVRVGGAGRLEGKANPFLEPVSNGVTKLDGSPVENVRYVVFSIRFLNDADSVPFYWPGQDTGNYNSTSTDGPHYAMNVWQMKGKFSGVVSLNMKWQGQRLYMIQQTPTGSLAQGGPMLGVNANHYTSPLDTYAGQWLDFCVKVIPGRAVDGDSPLCQIWMKPASTATWVQVWSTTNDLLSEIEDYTAYGIPTHYLGTANGGIYPSTRLSGFALMNRYRAFLEGLGTTGYMKCDHSPHYYCESPLSDDPGATAILNSANAFLGTI